MRRPRLEQVFSRSTRLVGRRIGERYVLVPVVGQGADLDSVLDLDRVSAFVWDELQEPRTGASIVDALVERFEVERERAESDISSLLGALVAADAVVAGGGRR